LRHAGGTGPCGRNPACRFEDALTESSAYWKNSGRILKIILFGSYAPGDLVDEPLTMKGCRSDFDLLVVVNNNKLSDFVYCYKAKGRLERDRAIKTPTSFIVHSRRFAGSGRSWADKGPDSVAAHLTGAHTPATLDSNSDSLIHASS